MSKELSKWWTIGVITVLTLLVIFIKSLDFRVIFAVFLLLIFLGFKKIFKKFSSYSICTIAMLIVFLLIVLFPHPYYGVRQIYNYKQGENSLIDTEHPYIQEWGDYFNKIGLKSYEIREVLELNYEYIEDIKSSGNVDHWWSVKEFFEIGGGDCNEFAIVSLSVIEYMNNMGYYDEVEAKIVHQPFHIFIESEGVESGRIEELDELEVKGKIPFYYLSLVLIDLPLTRHIILIYGSLIIIFRYFIFKQLKSVLN